MLALMARGVHLEGKSSKKDAPYSSRSNAYLNFATELNKALHGDRYGEDISKREVTKMLDKMLKEKKQVVGRGGLMERQQTGRITSFLRMCWESNRRADFDGSLGEWNVGERRDRVRAERRLPPLEDVAPATAQVTRKLFLPPISHLE
jgi:hypothetical protein